MVWLDPMASEEDIPGFYRDYFVSGYSSAADGAHTMRPFAKFRDFLRENIILGYYGYHSLAKKKIYAIIGSMLGVIPLLRSMACYPIRGYVPRKHADPQALLVDVGCGRGEYLHYLRALGWNVKGIEPDPAGAGMTEKKGIPVYKGTLIEAQLPAESVDCLTMMHVIEHVPDPQALIRECLRVVKRGGVLIMRTPNAQSLGHMLFKRNAYHLDPPRHLFIFTPKSMALMFKKCGIKKIAIKTLSLSARPFYDNSVLIAHYGKTDRAGVKPQRGRMGFGFLESLLCNLGFSSGEEIEIIVRKT
jgi:SAM-dependent methyltransferase